MKRLTLLILLCTVLNQHNIFSQADLKLNEVIGELKNAQTAQDSLLAKTKLANYYIYHSIDSARFFINQVINYPDADRLLTSIEGKHYLINAWCYQGENELDSAYLYMSKVLEINEQSEDEQKILETKLNLISIKTDQKASMAYDMAVDFLESLDTLDETHHQTWLWTKQLVARNLSNSKKYYQAFDELIEALQVSFLKEYSQQEAGIRNSIAINLRKIGDNSKAKDYFRRALNSGGLLPYHEKLIILNYANVYANEGEKDSLEYLLSLVSEMQPLSKDEKYKLFIQKAKLSFLNAAVL